MTEQELDNYLAHYDQLARYRRIMDSIHALGNIYYDKGRLEAYSLIAILASDLRNAQ